MMLTMLSGVVLHEHGQLSMHVPVEPQLVAGLKVLSCHHRRLKSLLFRLHRRCIEEG